MDEKQNQTRILHYDALCGIMLLFMMHHHLCGMCGIEETAIHMLPYKFLYFYIAYFFLKAGVFYQPEKTIKEVCIQSFKRLLIPYIVFGIIGYVWFGANSLGLSVHELKYWWWPIRQIFAIGRVEGNGPLWFLLSLFFVRVIFQMTQNKHWAQIVLIICCMAISFFGNYFSIRPRTISNVALGIVFYGAGALLFDIQYQKWVGLLSIVLWIIIYAFMSVFGWHLIDFSFNTTVLGYHPLWLLNCVIACIAVNNISRNVTIKGVLSWLWKNTMPFLCIHALVYEGLYTYWLSQANLSPYSCLVIYWGFILIICSTLTYAFKNKYLYWMIGEKKPC